MRRTPSWLLVGLTFATLCTACEGCGDDGEGSNGASEEGPRVHGLTPEEASQTLARIGETEITVGEFAEELASKGSFIRTRYASPERRREFLDQMIRFELLALEAERRGYDDLPEVQRTRKQMMIRRFLEQREEAAGPETIPAEDVRAYYESHQSEFNTPEQVRASHIQCRDRATAQRVLRELTANPNDLSVYRRLAERHNTDPETRDRLGDLRFFSRPGERRDGDPEVPDAVANAAFQIEQIGGIFPEVVHSDRGWHVVKLTGRRAAMRRSLEESERPIRNRIYRERSEAGIEALIAQLRAESDVEENLDLLSEVRLELPDGSSPTVETPFNPHTLDGSDLSPGPAMPGPPPRPPGRPNPESEE